MSVEADLIAPAANRVADVVRVALEQEVARLRAEPERVRKLVKADEEIMLACKRVGAAHDRLVGAKFTAGEIAARRELEAAAKQLRTIMLKHGRG